MNTRNHSSHSFDATRRPAGPLTLVLLTLMAVGVTGCIDHAEPDITEPEGGALFHRYVALGNSITAGFRSGGINRELQTEAYPVVLAAKANAPFGVPELAMPGCPPPFVGPLTTVRTSTTSCSPRTFDAPDVVQNLAVPGANTADASDPVGTGTFLNTLLLGGRTQIGAMQDSDPTLVSVWLGNNDALSAALVGDTLALTPTDAFEAEYGEIVGAVLATDAQDAILMGVANVLAVPALQPGAYFYAIRGTVVTPTDTIELEVADNCAPYDLLGNPNPLSARLVSFVGVGAALAVGDTIGIDCETGVAVPDDPADYLVDATEQATIVGRIAAFNTHIQQQADANGWIYVDVNASLLAPALADPSRVRKCQDLATATDSASFAAAVQSSCPVDLDPDTPETFFGSFMSSDGVHPSAAAQVVIADTIAGRLNAVHGLSLPVN